MKLLRICAVVTALSSIALAAPVSTALAQGRTVEAHTLVIHPSHVGAGTSTTLNFALTNTSSGSRLGSANFIAPPGFQITSASLPPGSPGTVSVSANVVQLRDLALGIGSTVNISVTAGAPDLCGHTTYTWDSAAKAGGNFTGTQLLLDRSGSSRTTLVTSDCALSFLTQPASTVVGDPITGSDFDPTGPPVSVEIVDGAGNPVSSSAPVTIAIGANPGGATLGGTATVPAKRGVAMFGDLTIDEPGNGYTLSASAKGLKGATSIPFNEAGTATQCLQNQTCTTDLSTPTSNLSITAIAGSSAPNAGFLSESVDIGPPLQCPGYTAQDPHWFGFFLSAASRRKQLTYTVTPAGQGSEPVGSTQFCFGASVSFTTLSGKPATATRLPDGSTEFVGLLPNCPAAGGPCLASRGTTPDPDSPTGFDIVLHAEVPAAFAGDPRGRA